MTMQTKRVFDYGELKMHQRFQEQLSKREKKTHYKQTN
jgi:hypothetical protein